jgi:hypothetical protein
MANAMSQNIPFAFKQDRAIASVKSDLFSMFRVSGFDGHVDIVPHMFELSKYNSDENDDIRCWLQTKCGYPVVHPEKYYIFDQVPDIWKAHFKPVRMWQLHHNLVSFASTEVARPHAMDYDTLAKHLEKTTLVHERLRDQLQLLVSTVSQHLGKRKHGMTTLRDTAKKEQEKPSGVLAVLGPLWSPFTEKREKEAKLRSDALKLKLRPYLEKFHLGDILKVTTDPPLSYQQFGPRLYILGDHYTPQEWNAVMTTADLQSLICSAHMVNSADMFTHVQKGPDQASLTKINKDSVFRT